MDGKCQQKIPCDNDESQNKEKNKGNVDIVDSTKHATLTTESKKDDCTTAANVQKGNLDIIDETQRYKGRRREEILETPDEVKRNYKNHLNDSADMAKGIEGQDKNENQSTALLASEKREGDIDYLISDDTDDVEVSETESCNQALSDISDKEFYFARIVENKGFHCEQGSQFNPFDQKPKRAAKNAATVSQAASDNETLSINSYDKTSEICHDPCDFCENMSRFICTSCKFVYCKTCLSKLHPAIGPYKCHKVIPVDNAVKTLHLEKCEEHGLIAQLFCTFCEQKRCAECASTRCSLHFKGRVSEADIEREKTMLVEELEKATAKLGFVEKYKEKALKELENIEITGLLRREQIRLEFVSFHELLVQKEEEMLKRLDQDVTDRMNHVRDTLLDSVASMEREDAGLTTTVTELVQSANDAHFIEECVTAKDQCRKIDDKIRDFDRDWTKNSTYASSRLLDNQFSMFLEKKHLSEKLDETVQEESQLRFTQSTLFIEDNSEPLRISDFLHIPVTLTSTEVSFLVQAFVGKKLVYENKAENIKNITLNTESTFTFYAGNRYLLKIIPTYKSIINNLEQCSRDGQPTHMILVVDFVFKAETPDSKHVQSIKRSNKHRRRNKSKMQSECPSAQISKTLPTLNERTKRKFINNSKKFKGETDDIDEISDEPAEAEDIWKDEAIKAIVWKGMVSIKKNVKGTSCEKDHLDSQSQRNGRVIKKAKRIRHTEQCAEDKLKK